MSNEDDVLDINLDELRVREIEEIEEITGLGIDEAFGKGAKKGKTLRALGYVVKKRSNPDFTLDMAGELKVVLQEPVPTTPGD